MLLYNYIAQPASIINLEHIRLSLTQTSLKLDKTMDQVLHNLYIGGLEALDRIDDLAQAGITHILSILEFDYCEYEEYDGYQRLFIHAEDAESQDLLCYFSATNEFIAKALGTSDNVVLVHCAMGQSRSAAVVCAYMMFTHHVSAEQALREVQLKRPMCAPNKGFMAQLQSFGKMLDAKDRTVKATIGRDRTQSYQIDATTLEGYSEKSVEDVQRCIKEDNHGV